FPFGEAAAKITLHARRSLVTCLWSFGEQLHHDRGETGRHTSHSVVRRHRNPGDVAMYPLKRFRRGEGPVAGQHLVERDAEGIEAAWRVDRAIRSTRLFGSHVRKSSGDELGSF